MKKISLFLELNEIKLVNRIIKITTIRLIEYFEMHIYQKNNPNISNSIPLLIRPYLETTSGSTE